ncbi:HigA family addiction module antitoxin [Lewinella sp. LCG006]|uniref:HigA family addiction module antitoxin n=1 Tax=Lewinella sp. LCG006 TaxID=3231911 RepID=UPI003461559D
MAIMKQEYQPQTVTHPGEDLREKLEELQMSPKEFAVRCGKPTQTISEVMNGKSAITPDMAIQFESVLQIPASYWLQRQYHYDEAVARNNRQAIIIEAVPWARAFPYAEMAKKGWLPVTRKAEEKAEALLEYFGIARAGAWENFYIKKELKASFRISLAHSKTPHALSAWLRQGDIQARDIDAPEYSAKKLKVILPELKAIMAAHPPDFFAQAQALCLTVGVKVVFTPCLPKAPINGVARWIDNNTTPLIQLSSRYKRNDIFWFSFFHELGHILLHGKKDVFLENVDYEGVDKEKETEADDFAVKWTLSEKEEAEVLAAVEYLDEDAVLAFAEKFGTHPAIIIGRLQYKNILDHTDGRQFIVKLDWESTDC